MEWFDRGKMVILRLTDLGIALLALGIILQLLFGNAMPSWATTSPRTS